MAVLTLLGWLVCANGIIFEEENRLVLQGSKGEMYLQLGLHGQSQPSGPQT